MRELAITFEEFCIMKTIALFQQGSFHYFELNIGKTISDCRFCPKSADMLDSYKQKLLKSLSTTIDNKFPNLTPMQKSVRAAKLSLMLPSFYVSFKSTTEGENRGIRPVI